MHLITLINSPHFVFMDANYMSRLFLTSYEGKIRSLALWEECEIILETFIKIPQSSIPVDFYLHFHSMSLSCPLSK